MEKVKDVVNKQQQQQREEDIVSLHEESHYVHTINEFIGLIDSYGFDKVLNDFGRMMGDREW